MFDFPAGPTDGQEFTPPVAGAPTYVFQTPVWLLKPSDTAGITISDTAPPNPVHEDLWWESDTGTFFIYYQDADSGQWVQAAGAAGTTTVEWIDVANKPATFPPDPHTHVRIEDGTGMATIDATGNLTVTNELWGNNHAYSISHRPNPSGTGTGVTIANTDPTVGAAIALCPNGLTGPAIDIIGVSNIMNMPDFSIQAGGSIRTGTHFFSETALCTIGPAYAGGGPFQIRPNGYADGVTGVISVSSNGETSFAGPSVHIAGSLDVGHPNLSLQGDGTTRYLTFNGIGMSWRWDSSNNIDLIINNTTVQRNLMSNKYMNATVNAGKPGGGDWTVYSDARIKTVNGAYTSGLDAIIALNPVLYTYKGNDTDVEPSDEAEASLNNRAVIPREQLAAPYPNSLHNHHAVIGTQFIGLVAQEAELAMPEMVKQVAGFIDGAPVADLREMDTTPLIYALVNAVKELTARLEALEGAA